MTSPCSRTAFAATVILAWCSVFCPLATGQSVRSQEPAARVVTIADATPLHLYLMDDIASNKNKVGDAIHFKVREAVAVAGIVVIAEGAAAMGKVVAVGHKRLIGHSGALGLSIDYAIAVSGSKIPLRGDAKVKGGSRGATTLESAAWFGPEAFIHKGTMMNAYVNGDQRIAVAGQASSQ